MGPLVSFKRYIAVLTLGACECDSVWRQGLCRCNQVKMRSYWSRVGTKPNDRSPQRERDLDTKIHREDGHVLMEAEPRVMQLQAKEHQELRAATRS